MYFNVFWWGSNKVIVPVLLVFSRRFFRVLVIRLQTSLNWHLYEVDSEFGISSRDHVPRNQLEVVVVAMERPASSLLHERRKQQLSIVHPITGYVASLDSCCVSGEVQLRSRRPDGEATGCRRTSELRVDSHSYRANVAKLDGSRPTPRTEAEHDGARHEEGGLSWIKQTVSTQDHHTKRVGSHELELKSVNTHDRSQLCFWLWPSVTTKLPIELQSRFLQQTSQIFW